MTCLLLLTSVNILGDLDNPLSILSESSTPKNLLLYFGKKELKPNNGKKTDPAHPAIYPTGIVPKGLNPYESKLYDLIFNL